MSTFNRLQALYDFFMRLSQSKHQMGRCLGDLSSSHEGDETSTIVLT